MSYFSSYPLPQKGHTGKLKQDQDKNLKNLSRKNMSFSNQTNIKHLALIMDGNGRWAEKQKHKRIVGHVRGAKRALSLIKYCSKTGLKFLSLFALSAENTLLRPKVEIKALTRLLEKIFLKHSLLLQQENIKLNILGDLSVFPSSLQNLCQKICLKTKHHQGLNLIVALNYGGRQEILHAVRKIAQNIKIGSLQPKDIHQKSLPSFFSSSQFPDPDLIVRTGGQFRLSNFYLWSSAYSEFYFTDTLWPDFDKKCLNKALKTFQKTQRRFGGICNIKQNQKFQNRKNIK